MLSYIEFCLVSTQCDGKCYYLEQVDDVFYSPLFENFQKLQLFNNKNNNTVSFNFQFRFQLRSFHCTLYGWCVTSDQTDSENKSCTRRPTAQRFILRVNHVSVNARKWGYSLRWDVYPSLLYIFYWNVLAIPNLWWNSSVPHRI